MVSLLCVIGRHHWRWVPATGFKLQQYCTRTPCGKIRQAVPGLWGWKSVGWAGAQTIRRWNQMLDEQMAKEET